MKLLSIVLIAATGFAQTSPDTILRAMKDEIERSKTLTIASLDAPYYVEYTLEDVWAYSTSASLGALLASNESRFRVPRVRVRVGDYKFDNTNYVYSDFYTGSRYDPDHFPLDDNYSALRRSFWLATDRAYKTAVEAIARKRAALKNVSQTEELPDYWKAQPSQKVNSSVSRVLTDKWSDRVRSLSQVFSAYPEVLSSSVNLDTSRTTYYFQNSEGTTLRLPDTLVNFQVRAVAQAPDGSTLRDAAVVPRSDPSRLPPDAELRKIAIDVAENLKALVAAPVGESYSGPVLFEGIAAAQLMADVLAPHLALSRKPVSEPGRPLPSFGSELEGRIGSRILPEFLSAIDDPTQREWNGTPMLGSYEIDEEGIVPKPVTLIEGGKLKSFLLTRQPVKGFEASNGRARMPGAFGARTPCISNLFIKSSESMKSDELRAKFIQMIKDRNKPYGIIIRKLDFPSTAPADEVRRLAGSSGGGRPVAPPVLVYRVFPDGKEELVRGLRFRGVSVRSLKDIAAVSSDSHTLHYLNNLAPFALLGAGAYVAPTSVVAPSLLFEDLELEKPQEDLPKLPLVPPPPLTETSSAKPTGSARASR